MKLVFPFLLTTLISFAQPGPDVWLGIEVSFIIGSPDASGTIIPMDSLFVEIEDSFILVNKPEPVTRLPENPDFKFPIREQHMNYLFVNGTSFPMAQLPEVCRFKSGNELMEVKRSNQKRLILEFKAGKFEYPFFADELLYFKSFERVNELNQESFRVSEWGEPQQISIPISAISVTHNPELYNCSILASCPTTTGSRYFVTRSEKTIGDNGKLEFWRSHKENGQLIHTLVSLISDTSYQSFHQGSMHFKDSLNGWFFSRKYMISDKRNVVYETHDGGTTWKVNRDLSDPEKGFFAMTSLHDTTYVFGLSETYKLQLYKLNDCSIPLATCLDSFFYKALDVFNTAQVFDKILGAVSYSDDTRMLSAENYAVSICQVNDSVAFRLNDERSVVQKTSDRGTSWQDLFPMGTLMRVCFKNDREGVLLGNHVLLYTQDGGESWTGKVLPKLDRARFNLDKFSSYVSPTFVEWVGNSIYIQDRHTYIGLIRIDLPN